MRKITLLLIVLSLFTFSGHAQAADAPQAQYVVHLLLDGIGKEVFDEALSQGLLPTVEKEVIAKGTVFDHAVTSFPSSSANNYPSAMSGLFPGSSGIPHLVRFSRERRKFVDYLTRSGAQQINQDFINITSLKDPQDGVENPATIFELLAEQGLPSAAVYSTFHRGSSEFYPRHLPIKAAFSAFVLRHPAGTDKAIYQQTLQLFHRKVAKIPRYTFVGILGTDFATHHYGVGDKKVLRLLGDFDHFVAELLATLEKKGIRDQTTLIISSDHGAHKTGHVFKLNRLLENWGIRLKKNNPQTRFATLAVDQRGVSVAQMYLMNPVVSESSISSTLSQFEQLPTRSGGKINLRSELIQREEVEFFIVRETAEEYFVFGKNNTQAKIHCIEQFGKPWCSYFSQPSSDPLHYTTELPKLADGRAHSAEEWQGSFTHAYPDVPIQLWQLFQSDRAGDAVVVLANGWNFFRRKVASHGAFSREDMRIPFVAQGPRIPQGHSPHARLLDAFSLAVQALDLKPQLANDSDFSFAPQNSANLHAQNELAQLESTFVGEADLVRKINISQFVRSKIFPVVPVQDFSRLVRLAQDEVERRLLRKQKLEHLLKEAKLQRKKLKKKHPLHTLDKFIDRESLLRGLLEVNQTSLVRMDSVLHVLQSCVNPDASLCRGR